MRGRRWGGYGAGRGGGWGWRNQYYATGLPRWGPPPTPAYGAFYETPYDEPLSQGQEVEMLKDEAEWLKQQLDAISRRMDELSQG
jgi:hypothetical protein